MKLTKKLETEIKALMEDYWNSYFEGNLEHWAGYLVDNYRNIGGTEEEIWNSKKEIVDYTYRIIDQMQGATELRNKQTQIIPYDPYIMVHELLDIFIKVEHEWTFYQKFRLSSLIQKTAEGWKVLHQHGSYPDSKTTEGEAIAFDTLKSETKKLQKAIQQRTIELEQKNRELEIEAALERVRSRSLAMHTTNELGEVVKVIVEKLTDLGVVLDSNGVIICTYFQDNKDVLHWIASADFSFSGSYLLPYFEHPIFDDAWQSRLSGVAYFSKAYSKEEKNSFWEYAFEHSDYKNFPNDFKQWIFQNDKHVLSFAWQKNSAILIPSHTGITPSESEQQILVRFAKVFEQAYTRFLDLQKAEAQTREAQIQLSMERVRARTMAMQKQEDLFDVAKAFGEQLVTLGLKVDYVSFMYGLISKKRDWDLWGCVPGLENSAQNSLIPYREMAYFTKTDQNIDAYEKMGNPIQVKTFTKEEKNQFLDYYFSLTQPIPDDFKKYVYDAPGSTIVDAFLSEVTVSICRYDSVEPYTQEQLDIFKRFSNEFRQAYIRFLDLQKAEAQVREAQIEAALERVRSKSLAMYKTDDLGDVVTVLFQQMQGLSVDMSFASVSIFIFEKDSRDMIQWIQLPDGVVSLRIPYFQHPISSDLFEAKASGVDYFSKVYTVEEKNSWVQKGFELTDYKNLPEEFKISLMNAPGYAMAIALSSNSGICIPSFVGRYPSSEDVEIMKRVGKVFEQAYTRFLDLQKAEAQAREAQIELALERVRARTMAMQRSDELSDAAVLLFQQVKSFGLESWGCGFNIWEKGEQVCTSYFTSPEGNLVEPFQIPLTEDPIFIRFYESRQKGEDFWIQEISGKEEEDHYKYLCSLPVIGDKLKKLPEAGIPFPTFQIDHGVNFSHGNLLFITYEPVPEAHDIFKRFGKVFDQTYTRFLDLQKAEAQTREAQINLAVERVRARALAMFKSAEIMDVVFKLKEELMSLDIPGVAAANILLKEKNGLFRNWDLTSYEWQGESMHITSDIIFDLYKTHPHFYMRNVWEKGEKYTVVVQDSNSLQISTNWLRENNKVKEADEAEQFINTAGLQKVYHPTIPLNKGRLCIDMLEAPSDEIEQILTKMGAAFDLAYKRFEDLQTAEAQTREAEIELALERVRARTMAMQKSEDLKEVIQVVYDQFVQLNINIEHTGFIIDYKEKDDMHIWLADQHKVPAEVILPYFDCAHWNSFIEAKKKGNDFFANHLDFEEKNKFYQDLFKLLPGVPEETIKYYFNCPGLAISTVLLDNVGLYIENFSGTVYTEEENKILMRFGKVFQQTYTRFLDLQKAEAQAREAQIQLALERVRARTMAMQHSNELSETATLLFNQIVDLGIQAWSSGFNIWQENDTYFLGYNTGPDGKIGDPLPLPLKEDVFFKTIYDAKKRGEDFFVFESEGESLVQTYRYMDTLPVVGDFMQSIVASGFELPKYQVTHCGFFPQGHLMFITLEPHPEAWDIFKRFTKEFQQTYTRFLDLQKAEAQAREAQIELSLERIRSHVTAMQESSDLFDIVVAMRNEFISLGHRADYFWHMRWLPDQYELSMTSADGNRLGMVITVPKFVHDEYPALATWEKGTEPIFVMALDADAAWNYVDKMNTYGQYQLTDPDALTADDIRHIGGLTFVIARTTHGEIGYGLPGVVPEPPSEDIATLMRFAAVFDLAYRRFEDLKQAEAQVREAVIQLALERVRAKSLAMHNTHELQEVVNIATQQLHNINIDINGGVFITLNDEVVEDLPLWASQGAADYVQKEFVPFLNKPFFIQLREAIKKRNNFYIEQLSSDEKIQLFKHLFKHAPWNDLPPERKKELLSKEGGLSRSVAVSQHTSIAITNHNGKKFSDKDNEILKRFGNVFEQSYTRFLDLQKAEAQAREAKIEAALERVRSRSMAMHKSDEMLSVIEVVSEQLQHLNLNFDTVNFGKNNQEGDFKFWITSSGQPKPVLMQVPPLDSVVQNRVKDAKQKGISFFTDVLTAGENREWSQHLIDNSEFKLFPEKVKDFSLKSPGFARSSFLLKNIDFYVGNYRAIPFTEEENAIFRRFAQVFEQAYTRFLDLQKAEAQTREAQIEVAVERVRAKALAMHKSDEILGVVFSMRNELDSLNIPGVLSTTITLRQDDGTIRLWDNTSAKQHENGVWESSDFVFRLEENHPDFYLNRVWNSNEKYFVVEQEENDFPITVNWVRKFDNAMADVIENYFKDNGIKHYWHPGVQLEHGRLNLDCEIAPEPEMETILLKMAAAFDLAYKRFLDLQKAEARTREAQIETSLERIRSRTMGMQKSEELGDVAALLFKELNRLVDNLWTCGFVLCEKDRAEDQWWLSDENGFIPAFYIPNIGDVAHANIYNAWLNGATYHTEQLEGAALQEHYDWLMSLPVARKIFDDMLAAGFKLPTWQKLHCAFFKTGYLVIITQVPCAEEEIFKRFAQVFDLTYTRFLDLQLKEEQSVKLIEEKQRLEKTLIDLQATQKQLIQSEKMASLGELTAGIAHEIQNPLNFVNNFSEVSKELLDEMREAIEKGDTVDAKDIMHDVIQNLEKINHHGKRAGDIVKGMLQHSRSSSGVKEPTDINALCDEYLRLSYHGLRAKDKSFNATMKTDFDNTIGNINIIPQDIGRVVLNLLTNSFYVVDEKKKSGVDAYQPTVSISTKKIDGNVEIRITDNGNGISQKILDKIFQPFFTTKPTGQGTGLGLSLSYDIITKGHGGELKVETKEEKGTTFIILLPFNNNG